MAEADAATRLRPTAVANTTAAHRDLIRLAATPVVLRDIEDSFLSGWTAPTRPKGKAILGRRTQSNKMLRRFFDYLLCSCAMLSKDFNRLHDATLTWIMAVHRRAGPARNRDVAVGPRATAFTVTSRPRSSLAKIRVIASTAAFGCRVCGLTSSSA